jgi:hypothetical protein
MYDETSSDESTGQWTGSDAEWSDAEWSGGEEYGTGPTYHNDATDVTVSRSADGGGGYVSTDSGSWSV